jgi:glutamate/aspartate transport system substrate-binding protein
MEQGTAPMQRLDKPLYSSCMRARQRCSSNVRVVCIGEWLPASGACGPMWHARKGGFMRQFRLDATGATWEDIVGKCRQASGWTLPALALAGALAGAPGAVMAAADNAPRLEVRIAGQQALAPKWVQSDGGVAGICPDILAALERVQPRLHFTGVNQSRSLPAIEDGLASGRLDAACALLASPRREVLAQRVGTPVYTVRHLLAARSDDRADIKGVADLVRLRALVTSHRSSPFTEQLKMAGVLVDDATDDNEVNLRKMLAGHGRFAYMNELTLHHYIRAGHLERRVRILPVALASEPSYFWVSRKADPALAALLAAALAQLKASGELDRIYARWSRPP